MILAKYDSYKDSGVEWLGEIPSHWEIKRVKDIFRLSNTSAPKGHTYQLLSLYTSIGVKPRDSLEQRGNKATTTEGYWIVKKNDIIINKLLAWMGAIGLSKYNGVTSPAYDIIRKKTQLDERYYELLFRTKIAQTEFKKYSRGIMEVRLRLYFDKLGQISVPFQNIEEQNSISNFLEIKRKKINNMIKTLQKKQKTYYQLRKKIIDKTLAEGLNTNKELIQTNIPYLRYINKKSSVRRLKDCIQELESGSRDKGGAVEEGVLSISAEHINWEGHFNLNDKKYVSTEYYSKMNGGKLRKYDIILTKDGATIGKSAIIEKMFYENMAVNEHMFVIRGKKSILPKYLYYWLSSNCIYGEICKTVKNTGVPGINSNFVNDIFINYFDINIQKDIVAYLDEKTSKIDKITSMINNQIETLKEFRKTLINNVVTGKVRVQDE